MPSDWKTRATIPELMDNPDCSEDLLLRTLRQFSSINRLVARYRTILNRWILSDMLKAPNRLYHLIDMGAGGCDIDVWLLATAKHLGLQLRITACDLDPRTIKYAQSTFGHVDGLTLRQTNLLTDPCKEPVDFVFANHFLHHLSDEEIVRLLRFWQPQVRHRLVFSDLLRDPYAYGGFWMLSLFYRNSFARYDGLVSIRRGFKPHELNALTRKALPHSDYFIHQLAPGRLVACIEGTRRVPINPSHVRPTTKARFIPKKR